MCMSLHGDCKDLEIIGLHGEVQSMAETHFQEKLR